MMKPKRSGMVSPSKAGLATERVIRVDDEIEVLVRDLPAGETDEEEEEEDDDDDLFSVLKQDTESVSMQVRQGSPTRRPLFTEEGNTLSNVQDVIRPLQCSNSKEKLEDEFTKQRVDGAATNVFGAKRDLAIITRGNVLLLPRRGSVKPPCFCESAVHSKGTTSTESNLQRGRQQNGTLGNPSVQTVTEEVTHSEQHKHIESSDSRINVHKETAALGETDELSLVPSALGSETCAVTPHNSVVAPDKLCHQDIGTESSVLASMLLNGSETCSQGPLPVVENQEVIHPEQCHSPERKFIQTLADVATKASSSSLPEDTPYQQAGSGNLNAEVPSPSEAEPAPQTTGVGDELCLVGLVSKIQKKFAERKNATGTTIAKATNQSMQLASMNDLQKDLKEKRSQSSIKDVRIPLVSLPPLQFLSSSVFSQTLTPLPVQSTNSCTTGPTSSVQTVQEKSLDTVGQTVLKQEVKKLTKKHRRRKTEMARLYDALQEIPWAQNFSPKIVLTKERMRRRVSKPSDGRQVTDGRSKQSSGKELTLHKRGLLARGNRKEMIKKIMTEQAVYRLSTPKAIDREAVEHLSKGHKHLEVMTDGHLQKKRVRNLARDTRSLCFTGRKPKLIQRRNKNSAGKKILKKYVNRQLKDKVTNTVLKLVGEKRAVTRTRKKHLKAGDSHAKRSAMHGETKKEREEIKKTTEQGRSCNLADGDVPPWVTIGETVRNACGQGSRQHGRMLLGPMVDGRTTCMGLLHRDLQSLYLPAMARDRDSVFKVVLEPFKEDHDQTSLVDNVDSSKRKKPGWPQGISLNAQAARFHYVWADVDRVNKDHGLYPVLSPYATCPSHGHILSVLQEVQDFVCDSTEDVRSTKRKKQDEETVRTSIRQSECAFRYRDIAIKKHANFIQIVLVPNTGRKNSLGVEALKELKEAFVAARKDTSCRVVLLNSSGGIFCSGLDLYPLLGLQRKQPAEELAMCVKETVQTMATFPKPVVAAVNGAAVGLGVSLLALCDVVLASEKATFSMPYAKLGYIPEAGATLTLPQVMGATFASDFLIRGFKLTSAEAQRHGLVTEVLWPTSFMEEVIPRVRALATQSSQVMDATKAMLRCHMWDKLQLVLENEVRMLPKQWLSPSCQQAIREALDNGFLAEV